MFYTSRGFSTLRATTAAGSGAPLPFTRCVDEGCTPSEAPRPSQEGGSQVVSHSTYWSDRYAPIRDVWQTRLCFLPARLPLSPRKECHCHSIRARDCRRCHLRATR